MATPKQIDANRRNARKSTGPRSAEGKAASSRNALKTGIYARGTVIWKENSEQLKQLEQQFTLEYCPETPTERSLVDMLIHLEWMLRRYRWLETEVWTASGWKITDDEYQQSSPGHAFIKFPDISRIHRLRMSAMRAFRETVAELRALQAERRASGEPVPEFLPVETSWDPRPGTPNRPRDYDEIGFVSSTPEQAPADTPPPAVTDTEQPPSL